MGPVSKIKGASTKNFGHAYWILTVNGVERFSESVKKENSWRKSFFRQCLMKF